MIPYKSRIKRSIKKNHESKYIIMKRIHILLMALVALSIQGCQDDFDVPSEQASRSYEQDAEVLNRFVDINKTTHEYYINPNKRLLLCLISPMTVRKSWLSSIR